MNDDTLSRKWFPLVAAIALFLVSSVMLMLGPILVPLATELHTSVAVAGQLATVTSLVWGFSAIVIGPVSDSYGRRRVLLTGLLLMSLSLAGSALVGSYGALFAARILTGFAAAMIPPTCYAACADQPTPALASRALAWTMAGGVLGSALSMPIIAWLANLGGWRLPFAVWCALMGLLWACVWAIFPRTTPASGQVKGFFSHYREVGNTGTTFWLLLAANFLLLSASWGTSSYLAAYLMQTYHLGTGEIALPLLLNGLGVMCGALAGGPLASHPKRETVVIWAVVFAGLLIAIAFAWPISLWGTVALTSVAGGLFILSQPLMLTFLLNLAGKARGTATGLLALSAQLGAMSGAALGGALLSTGGFSYIGLGCLGTAIAAAIAMAKAMREIPQDDR